MFYSLKEISILQVINQSWGGGVSSPMSSIVTPAMCVGQFFIFKRGRWGGTEGRGREKWRKEACVSVPLRVPRPGVNVGKVAHCLSHDPRGAAFFLLSSWMEMGHQMKPRKGATNMSAHPNTHVMAESETLLPTVHVCCPVTSGRLWGYSHVHF